MTFMWRPKRSTGRVADEGHLLKQVIDSVSSVTRYYDEHNFKASINGNHQSMRAPPAWRPLENSN